MPSVMGWVSMAVDIVSGPGPCEPDIALQGKLTMAYKSGRHFLQIPGPTTIPDRVLRAIDRAVILDHRVARNSAKLGLRRAGCARPRIRHHRPCHRVSQQRHRRVGGRDRQHAHHRATGFWSSRRGSSRFCGSSMAERFGLVVDWMEERLASRHRPGQVIEAHLRADTGTRRSRPCWPFITRRRPASPADIAEPCGPRWTAPTMARC